MNLNIDPDTTPDTYIEHRILVRIGDPLTTTPPNSDADPDRLEHGGLEGGAGEAWLGGGLPPMNDDFLSDFTTRYMDPTEVYARFRARRRVPRHRGDDHAPEQDERLPAARSGA